MTGAQTGAPEDTGLSAEEFSALAERFSAVAPLLRGVFPAAPEPPPLRGRLRRPRKRKTTAGRHCCALSSHTFRPNGGKWRIT